MMLPVAMIVLPLLAGLLCLTFNSSRFHRAIMATMAALLGLGCAALAERYLSASAAASYTSAPALEARVLPVLEAVVTLLIVLLAARGRRWEIVLMALASAALAYVAHAAHHEAFQAPFVVLDGLALIMLFIVAVIGGLIAIHAVGYMSDYAHHHADRPDRRPFFFFIIGLFLSAMLGLVVVNHLGWLFLFWEITTLCSFLLIGFPGTDEARKNAFVALRLNTLGGVAFAAGLFAMSRQGLSPALSELVPALIGKGPGAGGELLLLPIALLAIAGLTKSAQMPFSSWLLGAMVAPSTVSALLHSSTMVKAGVYLLIRLAPALEHTKAGLAIAMIGAVTFMLASFLAVPQRNAKRVLAYSTIANLGLIVACAGTGDQRAIWAAILLTIFHAVAKALLFLSVGTLEHKIGSRDIEDMQGLVQRHPGLAVTMLIGMAGMFLAPFGMLVSKWAALEALVQVNLVLPLLVAFGSAATLFFWCKWMGKLLTLSGPVTPIDRPSADERVALIALATMTILLCAGYPLLSAAFIEPLLLQLYGTPLALGPAIVWIMPIMLVTVVLLPAVMLVKRSRTIREVEPYMGGANTPDRSRFVGSMGRTPEVGLKNYYLGEVFPEIRLSRVGVVCCSALIALLLVLVKV